LAPFVQPDRLVEDGYVLVGDGLVQAIGTGPIPAGEKIRRGPDLSYCRAQSTRQVHSRSQKGQEDFIWSTRSAAAGGVTTIVDMPYDDGCLIATAERFRDKMTEAGKQARVDFALFATVAPEDGAARIGELVDAGAAAFKFSTFGTHPTRFPPHSRRKRSIPAFA
jgi:allantoinase